MFPRGVVYLDSVAVASKADGHGLAVFGGGDFNPLVAVAWRFPASATQLGIFILALAPDFLRQELEDTFELLDAHSAVQFRERYGGDLDVLCGGRGYCRADEDGADGGRCDGCDGKFEKFHNTVFFVVCTIMPRFRIGKQEKIRFHARRCGRWQARWEMTGGLTLGEVAS